MHIFADSSRSTRTGSTSPLAFDIDLPVLPTLSTHPWFLALHEVVVVHSGPPAADTHQVPTELQPHRIHISADCVGSTICNGDRSGVLRCITLYERLEPGVFVESFEFSTPYYMRVNQPELVKLRVTLSTLDYSRPLPPIARVHAVLELTSSTQ